MADHPKSPSLCVMPWIAQTIGTYGEVRICCYMDYEHAHYDDLDEGWNNGYMQGIRQQMLDGKRPDECFRCWRMEDHGDQSPRQLLNQAYMYDHKKVAREVEKRIDAGTHVDGSPLYFEIRFGNLCNLQCRMCSGAFSSQIVKDEAKLWSIDPKGSLQHLTHRPPPHSYNYKAFNWYEHDDPWEFINKAMPTMDRIKISGGEPTLSKECMDFLRRLVSEGYSKQISLGVNTNLTTVNKELLDIFKNFNKSDIMMSLDGIEETVEYIRYPVDWKTVRRNAGRVMELGRTNEVWSSFNMVVQAFNVLNLPAAMDEFFQLNEDHGVRETGFNISFSIIDWPVMYRLEELPPLIKIVARERLQHWLDKNGNDDYKMGLIKGGGLDAVMKILSDTSTSGDPQKVLDYQKFVDQNKKVSLEENLPLFTRLMKLSIVPS